MSNSVWPHRRQPTRLPRPWDSPGKNTGVGCYFLLQCTKVKSESEVAPSYPTLSDALDCSLPGSSIHGLVGANIFLPCIEVSQEAGQVVWYSHLFQNFPQFIVIHTVKGFGIVNKAEIDVFLEFSCFFDDPADVGNLVSGSSAFSKTSLNNGSFIHNWQNPLWDTYKVGFRAGRY